MTDGARVPDLGVVREEIIEIATAVGVLTLDGARVADEVPAVSLSSIEQVVALLHAGAGVLYLDAPALSLSDANAWLADRFGPEDETDDVKGWDGPGSHEGSDEAEVRADVFAHVGDIPLLSLGVLYGGILHVLTQPSDWYRALEDRAEHMVLNRVDATNASIAKMDKARQRAVDTFDAWFRDLPERLDTDEDWLSLTSEPARKQHVRRLAEHELATRLKHVDDSRMRSAVNQGTAIAADRRKGIIAARTAAVGDHLPELAAALAATPGFESASKKDRERLAREHIKRQDPLAHANVHAGRLAELALATATARRDADRDRPMLREPELF